MKSRIAILIVPCATVLLTQCVVVDETGAPSAPPANNVSGSARISDNVYNEGYQLGLDDGRKGRSRTPSRYDGTYPAGESDAFSIGYEKGYNEGIR